MVTKSLTNIPQGRIDKTIIFIFPILITILNSNWIFSPISNYLPDPWFYVGYFRYFFDYAPEYPSNIHYFVERLTWNIPGYLIYHVLPSLIANYVLHLLVCYTALFSLYGILNRFFGNRTALLSTVLLCCYPWFLRAVGWDYVDGAGIALMLLMIYLFSKAQNITNWKAVLFLAGCVHAALLITNLFWVGFAPSWIVYYLSTNYPSTKDKLARLVGEVAYFLMGNLALTLFCSIFYYSVTGDYFFLRHSVDYSHSLSQNEAVSNFIWTYYGSMPATWHIVPLLLVLSSIWQFAQKRRDKSAFDPFLFKTFLFFVIGYGWLITWHMMAQPYLMIFLYCSFAMPGTFLLLGPLLAEPLNKITDRQFNHILLVAAVFLLSPFYLVTKFPELEKIQGNPYFIAIAGIAIILCATRLIQRNTTTIIVVALSILSFLGGGGANIFNPDPNNGKDHFLAIIEASDLIDAYYPNRNYSTFRFWYRKDEKYSTFYNLSTLYLYPWGSSLNRILSNKPPSTVLAFDETDQFHDGDNIVILSSNANASQVLQEANNALILRNAQVLLGHQYSLKEGSVNFELYFTKLKLLP